MFDNVNNSKEWKTIDGATKNKEYNQLLSQKINSILNGKETISFQNLKKNSLFSNLSEKALERFNYIAGIDGDATTFNAEELRVLFALSDASLKDNQFVFDNSYKVDDNSGLVEATNNEVERMIQTLVNSNARTKTRSVDVSKYDRTKEFSAKISSSDVNEVMLALSDECPSGYTDKRTGENVSILQAVVMFEDFAKTKIRELDAKEIPAAFKEETGIEIEDFGKYRGVGGYTYKIGDWKYDVPENFGEEGLEFGDKVIYNEKTGEKIKLSNTKLWINSSSHTVPSANGYMFYLREYQNKDNSISIKFNYGESENIAPTSAEVRTNDNSQTIQYDPMFFIDPNLYNFKQNLNIRLKNS